MLHQGFLKISGVRTTSPNAVAYRIWKIPFEVLVTSINLLILEENHRSVRGWVGGRVVTVAVKDNMKLATSQVAAGRPILRNRLGLAV